MYSNNFARNQSYNYIPNYPVQQPTSSHYLPPQSQSSIQPVPVMQPTMVGMVQPPPPQQVQQQVQQPPPQQQQLPVAQPQPYIPNLMMAPQMNHVLPIHYPPPVMTQPFIQEPQHQSMMQQQHQPVVQQQVQQVAAPARQPEGEVTGGINSVLEYDLNNMSSFLSWCTFGMLKQNRNPSKDFENLINSVLIATRLPKSTIIISLEYLNQRFSKKKIEFLSELEIFIKLITALILGNKFNDDNTFTNRSWCGATGLEINLINFEEKTWLNEINWKLNVVKFELNILTLEECWKTWLDKYTDSIPSSPISTSPIEKYQSLPSSPISTIQDYSNYSSNYSSNFSNFSNLNLNSTNQNLHSSLNYSPVSPIKDSIWSQLQQPQTQQQQQNTNTIINTNNNANNSNYLNQNIWSYNYDNNLQPIHYLNSNFVGYTNPYYTFNMASC